MAESAVPSVTFGVKVTRDDGPGGHVHFDVFAGRNEHARGRSGSWVLRHDEFEAFLDRLKPERLTDTANAFGHEVVVRDRLGSENTDG